tara:strand:- start:150 stop:473 length:324 start_codon:yes stop_codon:yes gene_type:complete
MKENTFISQDTYIALRQERDHCRSKWEEAEEENKILKKRAEEAEGENTIIKGIGQNSPEMKALQKENYELRADLARAKEDHQYDNLVHRRELESFKNPLPSLRKKGF